MTSPYVILERNDGDKVQAGIELGRLLMKDDTSQHKAGYSYEAAASGAHTAYGLTAKQLTHVRRSLRAMERADGLTDEQDAAASALAEHRFGVGLQALMEEHPAEALDLLDEVLQVSIPWNLGGDQ